MTSNYDALGPCISDEHNNMLIVPSTQATFVPGRYILDNTTTPTNNTGNLKDILEDYKSVNR